MKSGKAAANKMIGRSNSIFLVCRAISHRFDESTSSVKQTGGKFFWSMKCSRCGTVRTKILNRQGRIVGADYSYPKGYTAPGIGRLDANAQGYLRLHVINNVLGDF